MQGKLPGIQVGRAIAAASVFYFHSYIGLTYFDKSNLRTWNWLASNGASGVDLFFAISGFIVCYVAAAPDFTRASFLWKRFFRIYPLNAAVTLAMTAIVLHGIRISDDVSFAHVVQSILILPQKAPVNSVGWTLEYELAFYLLAAIILPFGGPRALLGYCVVSYWLGIWLAPETPLVARFITEHHAAFGAGVLAYLVATRIRSVPGPVAWLMAVMLPFAGLVVFQFGHVISMPVPTPAACFLAVIGLAFLPWAPGWLVKLGDASYGFYLFHWPVIGVMTSLAFGKVQPSKLFGEPWRWNTFLYIWILALLSWTYFEKPINRWARRVAASAGWLKPPAGEVAIPVRSGVINGISAATNRASADG
jgi:peptidoglycan/LPS O-acetylase OafA/YrhL